MGVQIIVIVFTDAFIPHVDIKMGVAVTRIVTVIVLGVNMEGASTLVSVDANTIVTTGVMDANTMDVDIMSIRENTNFINIQLVMFLFNSNLLFNLV